MRRRVIGLAIGVVVAVILISLWFWESLRPSDILEIRARILPAGRWRQYFVTDLDRDGNDEIVVETRTAGWRSIIRPETVVTAVTMRNGRFVTFPMSLAESIRASEPKGRRLVGGTEEGDVAVVELLPNGKWERQILLSKEMGIGMANYDIGDLDGNGLDDDVVVLMKIGGEKVIWFHRHPDGRWRKESEINLPIGKGQNFSGFTFTAYGVETWGWTGSGSFHLPLLFRDGRLEIGQIDERVHSFESDLDRDGKREKVLVRFLPKAEKVRWQVRSGQFNRRFEGKWDFKGWQVLDAASTDKFGDGRWHLLLAMVKPFMVRVVDCCFNPKRGWKVTELSRWEIKKVMPWEKLSLPDRIELEFGDTDGDGRDEVVAGRMLLRRSGQRWVAQSLTLAHGQTLYRYLPYKVGNRFWFERTLMHWSKTPWGFSAETESSRELGTFDAHGRWQPVGQYQPFQRAIEDLNGDRYPEVLTCEGMIWVQPCLYYRSTEGQWRKAKLAGDSLARELNALLKGVGGGLTSQIIPVRWDGKEWFVILWTDGVVQAVTMKRR